MKALKVTGITVAILAVIGVGLSVSGYGGSLMFWAFITYNKPAGEFDPAQAVAAPDYSMQGNWAALPEMADPADLTPEGIEVAPQGELPVDVFFIHPTGYLTTASWTSPMEVDSGTEENTSWMMANQASAYNGCCNVYAPRYREANIFSYFGEDEAREEVLGFAYEDVKRAFEYYLENYNSGRAFIIAGHSQGAHHSKRLLKEVIDASDLHQRMIAAYMIGSVLIPVSPSWFDSMDHIEACDSAEDLHCVVHWDTMPEGAPLLERDEPSLCTNPLTWRVDDELAEAELNEGAVVPEGAYITVVGKNEDAATGQVFESIGAPLPGHTWAQCKQGTLYTGNQKGTGFDAMGSDQMGTYHGLDYALFYMNIHNNAKLRASRYLSTQP
jgi:hypothetical protein